MKSIFKESFVYLLMLLIIPFALYINFFVYKIQLWDYETKAWLYYSLFLILINLFIVIFIKVFLLKVLKKINNSYLSENKINDYVNISLKAFLFANVFWIIPIYRLRMWYIVPLFQIFFVFLFSIRFINKNFIEKSKLPFLKRLYTAEKLNKKIDLKKMYLFVFISLLFYFLVSLASLKILKESYNPLNKSLEYYMEGSGFKPVFKK